MAQKYDLTDIGNALSRVMDNPMTKIIRSGSIGVLGVVNPVAGIVGGIGNDLLSEYNTFKLGHLLNGLASGFNLERRLNELYNYVNSSPEKAIIVANLFKQTVNAECPKVCVIYAINEQISNFAQTYPTNLKASSNEALLFMRRYRFANCSCFSCCFKDAYPSSNVQ